MKTRKACWRYEQLHSMEDIINNNSKNKRTKGLSEVPHLTEERRKAFSAAAAANEITLHSERALEEEMRQQRAVHLLLPSALLPCCGSYCQGVYLGCKIWTTTLSATNFRAQFSSLSHFLSS